MFILDNQCNLFPGIPLDDAVEYTGKVDLRWQQLEVVGKPLVLMIAKLTCTYQDLLTN